jgi:hypothetical protein
VAQFSAANPKQFVRDMSDGYVLLTVSNLRRFKPHELKILLESIMIIEREVRSEQFEENDFDNIRKKQQRLQRLYRGNTIINGFIKHHRIKFD